MTTSTRIDLGDGRELVFAIITKGSEETTLKDIWKPEAPFSYNYMILELIRHDVISEEDHLWILYPKRGNHPTCSVHVRALYESLLYYNCIDELSFPEVQRIWNATFRTNINSSKVLETKDNCTTESRWFNRIFEAFAKPDANAETNNEA